TFRIVGNAAIVQRGFEGVRQRIEGLAPHHGANRVAVILQGRLVGRIAGIFRRQVFGDILRRRRVVRQRAVVRQRDQLLHRARVEAPLLASDRVVAVDLDVLEGILVLVGFLQYRVLRIAQEELELWVLDVLKLLVELFLVGQRAGGLVGERRREDAVAVV